MAAPPRTKSCKNLGWENETARAGRWRQSLQRQWHPIKSSAAYKGRYLRCAMTYVWSAAGNEELLRRICSAEEQSVKEVAAGRILLCLLSAHLLAPCVQSARAPLPQFALPLTELKPTGILLHDFVVRSAALGVWPHPSLVRACTAVTNANAAGAATSAASAKPLVVVRYPPLEEPALPPFALPPHAAHLGVAQVDRLPSIALSTLSLGAYQWDTGAMRALAWALPACRTLVNVRCVQFLRRCRLCQRNVALQIEM